MRKKNIGKNVSDGSHGTRQWSAVATAIAATENKECLDLFVQLDGLSFIAKWLKDAQNVVDDSGNGGFDELIVVLLRGLERLQVDHDLSVGSGIGLTVLGLVGHSSLVVREKAKELCERWARVQDVDGAPAAVISASISPDELPTQEIIMVENDKAKSESTLLTGISSTLEDVKEKPENNCLTTSSSPSKHKTLTSDIDVDHGLESATKTETMEDEEMVDLDHGNTVTELETTSRIGDSAGGGGLQDSPDADNHPKMTSDTESDEADEDDKKDDGTESGDDSASHSCLEKRGDDLINKRPSDMELDYGMVDPLELARQVANEVELEVDSPEQSCSSTTSEPEPGPSSKGSPSPAEPEHPATQINETGQESGLNPEKGFSGFDLNQEVSSHEIETENERLVDQIVTPISVVSASRAAAADGLRLPLCNSRVLSVGKGSAATSAFRRIPESEKTYSSSSSHNNSNQRLNHLDFDLNVAEDSDDKLIKLKTSYLETKSKSLRNSSWILIVSVTVTVTLELFL
ncbi:putative transcription regulator IWS1 family [Helianthus annuus]|nr:putative transcription regulator IWS1 family [Helianthus annuus]